MSYSKWPNWPNFSDIYSERSNSVTIVLYVYIVIKIKNITHVQYIVLTKLLLYKNEKMLFVIFFQQFIFSFLIF